VRPACRASLFIVAVSGVLRHVSSEQRTRAVSAVAQYFCELDCQHVTSADRARKTQLSAGPEYSKCPHADHCRFSSEDLVWPSARIAPRIAGKGGPLTPNRRRVLACECKGGRRVSHSTRGPKYICSEIHKSNGPITPLRTQHILRRRRIYTSGFVSMVPPMMTHRHCRLVCLTEA